MFAPDRYVAALRFAAERHSRQRVPGTELPYLVHVTSVAAEVIAVLPQHAEIDADLAVLCALLHDTLEDTATTRAELEERFGAPIADGVQALTKNAALAKPQRMPDSLLRIRACPRAVWLVKLADRITNLGQPPRAWTAERRRAYRDEARTIADALGEASAVLEARLRLRIELYAAFF